MQLNLLKKIILACLCAGIVIQTDAQTQVGSSQEMRLTLEAAKIYALDYNKNIANAQLEITEAQEKLKEVIAQGLPQIDATVDYTNFFGASASIDAFAGMEIEFPHTSNFSVGLTQLIFSRTYQLGVHSAKLYREIMETTRSKTELEIKAQVANSYLLSLVSMESQQILDSNIKNIESLKDKTKALTEAGFAEQVDYDRLSVQETMLRDAARAAKRQTELALNMLRLQMGLSWDVPIVLTEDFQLIIANSNFAQTLAQELILEENFDFRQMSLQTKITEKQLQMEKSAYLPTLAGFYSYTGKILKPEFDMTPNHVIGLNLQVPIFSSGVRRSKVRQAQAKHQIAQNQTDLLTQQLEIQEKQLRFNLNNALEQYNSQSQNLEISERVYKNVNDKFEQGMVSSIDLVTANNSYLQAQNSYINSLLQLTQAQMELDKLYNSL